MSPDTLLGKCIVVVLICSGILVQQNSNFGPSHHRLYPQYFKQKTLRVEIQIFWGGNRQTYSDTQTDRRYQMHYPPASLLIMISSVTCLPLPINVYHKQLLVFKWQV